MSRFLLASIAVTLAAAIAACQSSGRYGDPAHAAAAVGVGVTGAVANRAMGGCLAECIAGTVCNPTTGLCMPERPGAPPPPSPTARSHAKRPAPATANASYEPGHEYEVPPASGADAGCSPTGSDAGPIACEMDGGGA